MAARRGRPRRIEESASTRRITVKVTPAEYEEIRIRALGCSNDVSTWVRHVLNSAAAEMGEDRPFRVLCPPLRTTATRRNQRSWLRKKGIT